MSAIDPQSDLLGAARGGDRPAFETLAAAARARLEAFVQRSAGPSVRRHSDLDDVLQETLLRAWRSVASAPGSDIESFERWLCGIARNVILEGARRVRRGSIALADVEPAADASSPSRIEQRRARFERLQAALDRLSADHRRVIILARIDRLPIREVAKRMRRSPEAASQLLWRALGKLKESFGSTDSFHLPDERLVDRGQPDDE